MTRLPLVALALAGFALPAVAQAPRQSSLANQILGTWEGPYQSESVPPGSLKLVVARGEQNSWKVTMEVLSDQPPPAGEVQNFTVTNDSVSWTQLIAEMECRSTATLVAGVLKGTAECWQGGAVAVTATFLLEKKAGS